MQILNSWQWLFPATGSTEGEPAPDIDLMTLEDRVLFSVAPLMDPALLADVQPAPDAQELATAADTAADPLPDGALSAAPDMTETDPATPADSESPTAPAGHSVTQSFPADQDEFDAERVELVVVAPDVQDLDQILADLRSNSTSERKLEVVILDANEDGFAQLDRALAGDTKFNAIHFLTHGDDAMFRLGSTWFDQAGVTAHQLQIANWADSLTADADLLFYGCDLATSENGRLLFQQIHDLTGADVAAGDDSTGSAARGGDWDLEVRWGEIETLNPLSDSLRQSWDGILATYVVTNTNDSGAGSLRQAILDANANAGLDTIQFNIGGGGPHVITLASELDQITDSVILDATTESGYSGTPVIALDGSGVAGSSAGIQIDADNSTIRGFSIYGFVDDGLEINGGAGGGDNNLIENNWIGVRPDGTVSANADNGILIVSGASNNTVRNNVLSGNGAAGILIRGSGSDGNTVSGNIIGLDSTGTSILGNGVNGVRIDSGASNNTVGGASAALRNVISGNGVEGVYITDSGTDGNIIQGNYIGTDLTGLVDLGNLEDGIEVDNGAANTIIGGAAASQGNVIAGNSDEGVSLNGGSTGAVVRGNLIGVAADGVTAMGNGQYGIEILGDSANNVIGGTGAAAANTIANSVSDGVYVQGALSANNAVLGNSIYNNGGLGINLGGGTEDGFNVTANDAGDGDTGPNSLQNFPVLTAAASASGNTYLRGTVDSAASTTYRIEFFASASADGSGHGEGTTYLGSTTVTTDGSGNASFDVTLSGVTVTTGYQITATATADLGGGSYGGTSEFAATVTTAAGFQVTVDASSTGSTPDQASVTVSHTTSGSNRLMLVGISYDSHGDTVTSVTYNGVALTLVGAQTISGAHSRVEIWSMVAPTLGTHNVVVNLSGIDHNGVIVGVTTYNGVNQSSPLLDFSGNSGSSITAAVTVNSAAYDLVFGIVHSHKGTSLAPDAGQTELWDIADGGSNGGATTELGAATVTNTWTVKDDDWSAAAVAIQAVTNHGVTVTLSPVQDSYIRASAPTANAGSATSMIIDRETGDLQRSLVQFDLSSLPTGATITNAKLVLESTQIGGAITIDVRQVLESWVEGSTTWNRRSTGVNWSTAGGSFSGTSLDTLTTDSTGRHEFDMTSLVQSWVDGSQQNNGVMVASFDGGGNRTVTYDTREGTTAPQLLLTYVVPANVAPTLDSTKSPTLSAVAQNAAAPTGAVGTLVSALVDFASPTGQVDNVTDSNTSAQLGIAITSTGSIGTWYYSEDNGTNWNLIGSVSNTNALLLAADSSTRIFFQPNTGVSGTINSALTFRAWDQTSGWNGGIADASSSGGTTAFSTTTDTASITINVAPVITLDSANLVTNGSFESGSTGWTGSNGMEVSSSPATYGFSGTGSGSFIAEVEAGSMAPTSTPSYIEQTITTVAGQSYVFQVQAHTRTGSNSGDIGQLVVDGVVIAEFVTDDTWQTFAATFTASGASTTIRIVSQGSISGTNTAAGDGSGLLVDDVRVRWADNAVIYAENASAVAIADAGSSVIDSDSATLSSATITLTDAQTGDRFRVNGSTAASGTLGSGIGWTRTDSLVTLSGSFSKAAYEAALQLVQFENTSEAPSTATRHITVSVSDGTYSSNTVTVTASVTAVNDAPVLATGSSPVFAAINEDQSASATVASIVNYGSVDRITDVDSGAVEGIAITGLTSGPGTWQYSTDGVTYFNVGTVSSGSALLLRATDFLRYVGDGLNGGSSDFTFRAWDQTSGTAGTKVDTSTNGGTSAFSTAQLTATNSTTSVNDAPVLDNAASPTLNSIAEDSGPPVGAVGTLITSLVDTAGGGGNNNVSDVDTGAVIGIAITAADTANGSWYYSVDGGANWNALGAVSDASARLLAANANTRIYFQPNADYNGSTASALTFRAWDRTSGTNGATADTSTNGGTTAFSSATDTAALTVTSVNDDPVITSDGGGAGAFVSIAENTTAVTTVTATDTDVPAQTLTYSITGGSDSGRFTIDASSGVLTFVAAPNYESPTDSNADNVYNVIVQASDGAGGTTTQAISVTVTDAADRPTGADQALTMLEDGVHTFAVAEFGFSDQDAGDSLAAVRIDTLPSAGTLTLNGVNVTAGQVITAAEVLAGDLQFRPVADANGAAYAALSFSVRDQSGLFDASPNTLTFHVTAVNDAPTITAPADQIVDEDTTLGPLTITIGDVDNAATTLMVTASSGDPSIIPDGNIILGGSGASRTITVTPAADATGGPVTIQLTVSDGFLTTLTTFQVTVSAVNDTPQIAFPVVSAVEDTPFTFTGGSAIVVSDADGSSSLVTVSLAFDHGTLTLSNTAGLSFLSGDGSSDASVVFTGTVNDVNAALDGAVLSPDTNFFGSLQVTYQVQDASSATTAGIAVFSFAPVNDAPVAIGENFALYSGQTLTITAPGVIANDLDVEADPLTAAVVQGPAHGSLTLNADGSFTYIPTGAYFGDDSFTYHVSDAGLTSAPVLVQIEVAPFAAAGPSGGSGYSGAPDTGSSSDGSDSDSDHEVSSPVVAAGVGGTTTPTETRSRPTAGASEVPNESGPSAAAAGFAAPETEVDGSAAASLAALTPGQGSRAKSAFRHDPSDPRRNPVAEIDWSQATETELLDSLLDTLKEELQSEKEIRDLVATTAAASTVALTAGYAIWALKSGHLLAALLAGMPAWRQFDPLPVVERYEKSGDDDESLVDIASQG